MIGTASIRAEILEMARSYRPRPRIWLLVEWKALHGVIVLTVLFGA